MYEQLYNCWETDGGDMYRCKTDSELYSIIFNNIIPGRFSGRNGLKRVLDVLGFEPPEFNWCTGKISKDIEKNSPKPLP